MVTVKLVMLTSSNANEFNEWNGIEWNGIVNISTSQQLYPINNYRIAENFRGGKFS